jgi:NADPH:quinone reductase-like Zn-dependent oxidoreductase
MKFLQMSKFGKPTEVVEVVESDPPPPPAANEATVAVEYSAIGLAELLMIRGMYAIRPQPPAPLGNEAIGRVVAVGASVKKCKDWRSCRHSDRASRVETGHHGAGHRSHRLV